jgi:uncharacterized protein YbaP (TraB family)
VWGDKHDNKEKFRNKTFVMMFNNILFFILFVNFTVCLFVSSFLKLFGYFFLIQKICSSTLLWRIETSPPSYIFGSIHVPYSLVWPYVSNETREAFQSSTHFYAEIDAKSDAYWDDFLQCLVNRSKRTRRSSWWNLIDKQNREYLI